MDLAKAVNENSCEKQSSNSSLKKSKRHSSELKETLFTPNSNVRTNRSSKTWFQSYLYELKERKLNFPSMLLVFYTIPVTMSLLIGQHAVYSLFVPLPSPNCWQSIRSVPFSRTYAPWVTQCLYLFCSHPLSGWLADVKIGRGKAVNLSLWFCWSGILLQTVSYAIRYAECGGVPVIMSRYVLPGGSLVLLLVGISSFQSNILAYGMDQIVDGSSAQVRALIYWLTWGLFLGFSVYYLVLLRMVSFNPGIPLFTAFTTFLLLSIAVCLNTLFHRHFNDSGTRTRNPYKIVFSVLKYARHATGPVNRSALTYWEETIPSRIDLSKAKYGGPFSEADVEDVKTFGRVVAVFLTLGGLFIPFFSIINHSQIYVYQFNNSNNDLGGYAPYIIWQTFFEMAAIVIPLFELLVVPLFPKIEYFVMNMFVGFKVAHVLLIFALIIIMVMDVVGRLHTRGKLPCYLDLIAHMETLNISYEYFIVPACLIGIVVLLAYLKAFEFICSQAPTEMSGMITGVFWLLQAIYISIGSLVSLPFTILHQSADFTLPCTFWVLLVMLVVCIGGLVVFVLVGRWYQLRQRQCDINIQSIVESHYTKYMEGSTSSRVYTTSEIYRPMNRWSDEDIPIMIN